MSLHELNEAWKMAKLHTYGGRTMTHRRELDVLGYCFSGTMATAALIGLFLIIAIVVATPVLLLRFQYFQ
jgi:hypothetical protein